MMRWTPPMAAALIVIGCSGSGGASESDYEASVFEFLAEDNEELEEGDWSAVASRLDTAADRLDGFNPPSSIEQAHEGAVDAFRGAAEIYLDLEESGRSTPPSDDAKRLVEFHDATRRVARSVRERIRGSAFRRGGRCNAALAAKRRSPQGSRL